MSQPNNGKTLIEKLTSVRTGFKNCDISYHFWFNLLCLVTKTKKVGSSSVLMQKFLQKEHKNDTTFTETYPFGHFDVH